MKKLYSLLIFAFLGLNSFAQCGALDNQGYFGFFADGSGAMNYENDTECSWLIMSPNEGGYMGLGFYNFDTELNYDYVRIYDGTDEFAPLLGEFSGSDIPDQVQTSGQYAFVTFSSDFSNTFAGFDGYWNSSALATLSECSGYVDDGLDVYPDDAFKEWLISPTGNPDEITFEFDYMDMESCCDFVKVYDGTNATGDLLGSFSGTTVPMFDLIAYSGSMYLEFTSNSSNVGTGWGGSWSSSGLWYIPSDYSSDNTPMIYECNGAPEGYFLANQTCAQALFEFDPYCVNTDWDNFCRSGYLECLGVDDCVDESLVDLDPTCPSVFDPVCGCDNFTYDNSCLAIAAGVTSWTSGACSTQVFGCMVSSACNFDPFAIIENGSCLYDDICGDCGGMGTVLGCMDWSACNYDAMANTACNIADLCSYPGCTDEDACNYSFWSGCDDGSCEYNDECGNCGGTETSGCTDSDACNYDSGADCNDNSCTYVGCTEGCTEFDACNYDFSANVNDGSCLYDDICGDCGGMGTVLGCMDSSACNYDAMANTACNIADLCSYPGCTDEDACNYTFWSGCDDGSCEYNDECGNCGGTETSGCTDPDACNFDSEADCNDNMCVYVGCTDGCTDFDACNFNPNANVNDGSCTYPGCTIMMACNYDSQAGCSDGSCFFIGDSCNDGDFNTVNDVIQNNCNCEGELQENEGCIDPLACNFNPDASIDNGTCEYLELYAIIGSTAPDPLTSADYFYSSTMGSSYVWQASNGAVTAGQGTASVTVVWGELGLASISVTEMSADGCEGDMVTEEFNISSTSMTEISAESLSVYPNPASSFLIIKSDLLSSGNSVIKLIDSKGRLVLEDSLDNDNRLDVSGVANGVYFLNLINDQTVENLRIVIQK
jgi:hypothetical protein